MEEKGSDRTPFKEDETLFKTTQMTTNDGPALYHF